MTLAAYASDLGHKEYLYCFRPLLDVTRRGVAFDTDADIALVQEAREPSADLARRVEIDPAPWRTAGAGLNRPWRAAVVKLSERVRIEPMEDLIRRIRAELMGTSAKLQ